MSAATSTPPLVGLIGRAQSGKDTLADFLVANHGYQKAACADPLRAALLGLDPIVANRNALDEFGFLNTQPMRYSEALDWYGYEEAKRRFPEVRRVLQRFGTEAIRALDSEFWVNQAKKRIENRTTPLVFTDVRFPNEVIAIVEAGGILVKVERPSTAPGSNNTLLSGSNATHSSETSLDNWGTEMLVVNDGSLADLEFSAQTVAAFAYSVFTEASEWDVPPDTSSDSD